MNYDERRNAIGAWLHMILGQYVRPSHLDDDAARVEISHMTSDLNEEWPLCNPQQFQEVGERFWGEVRKANPGRQWPTIGLMVKALRKAKDRPKPEAGSSDDKATQENLYRMVVYWWRKYQNPHPGIARPHHADRMVKEGVATPIEIHEAGFKGGPGWMDKVRACDTDTPHNQQVRAEIAAMGCKRMEAAE